MTDKCKNNNKGQAYINFTLHLYSQADCRTLSLFHIDQRFLRNIKYEEATDYVIDSRFDIDIILDCIRLYRDNG